MKDPEDHEFHSGAPDINVVEIDCVMGLLLIFSATFLPAKILWPWKLPKSLLKLRAMSSFAAPQFDAAL